MFFLNKMREYKSTYRPCILILLIVIVNLANREIYGFSISRSVGEYEVKAAFLYNFAKFIEWPNVKSEGPDMPIIIGVIGEDPFGSILDQTIKNKTACGRGLVIKRFRLLKEIESCHILFVSSSEEKRLQEIIEIVRGWYTITVGDMDLFAEKGGMIGFTLNKKKVRFSINIKAVEEAGLKISSKLLKIANIVKDKNSE